MGEIGRDDDEGVHLVDWHLRQTGISPGLGVAQRQGQRQRRLTHGRIRVDDGNDRQRQLMNIPDQRKVFQVLMAHHARADNGVA